MTYLRPDAAGSVMLCLDGSHTAAVGLPYAVALAKACNTDILLLGVLERVEHSHPRAVDALGTEVMRQAAVEYLEKFKNLLGQHGLATQVKLVEGNAAAQIIHVAEKDEVRVIVMATHGSRESTQFRLGGTAEKVVQHARQSVFLARSSGEGLADLNYNFKRVLLLLDGSLVAEASLISAQALAQSQGAEIVMGYVASQPVLPTFQPLAQSDLDLIGRLETRTLELANSYLKRIVQRLVREGIPARYVLFRHEDKWRGVLELVREVHADVLVLASHGQTSSRHTVHGSLTQHLLGYSPIPIWVIQNSLRQNQLFDRS